MVKRFIMLLVLLAGTALTVLVGEGFDFLDIDPTATIPNTSTSVVEATATTVFTDTAVPTATAVNTNTPVPTSTPVNTATATTVPTNTATTVPTKTNTPIPTAPPIAGLFRVQSGSPVYTINFAHPEAGCNWTGVAGQVLSADGAPLTNYILKVSGIYNGAAINQIGLSGLVANEPYGPGSFEFVLGTKPLDSVKKLTIQLFSPSGVEMIGPVSFNTSVQCSKNLMIINFQQN